MAKRLRFEYVWLLAVFVIATCGLIYELVAGTLASYLLGDSVKQFSLVIGVYLFSMGVGSYLAKFVKSQWIRVFIEIELLVGLVGGLSAIVLYQLFAHAVAFQWVLYAIVGCTGVLVGLEIPLLMHILRDKISFKNLISNVFAVDYIGALLASIAFPLVMMPHLGLVRTALFFGLINTGVALWMMYRFRADIPAFTSILFKAIAVVVVLSIGFVQAESWVQGAEEKMYGENIIYAQTTPYQRVVLTHEHNDYRLYLNNNLQFSSRDEYRYHEALVHPAMSMAPRVKKILILGGGDGMAAREILKYPEVESVTLVDLDQGMTSLFAHNTVMAQLNQGALNNPKLHLIHTDALVWAQSPGATYDVIFIDFPDPSNFSLGKLYTLYFYQCIQKKLNPNGVMAVQTTSPYFAPKSFWCIHATLGRIFPQAEAYHTYVPSFGEWGFTLVINGWQTQSRRVLRRVNGLKFYNYAFQSLQSFAPDMQVQEVEVNRLDNQILVQYFDEEWGRLP